MPAVRRTQQQRVRESTERLIEAAAELIAEGGYEAASAAAIGRRAGYSRSMVRVRFGSKAALADAVVRSAYEGPLTVELPETASGLERVLARLDTMASLARERPALIRTIFAIEFQAAGSGAGIGAARVAAWVVRLRTDVREGIERGQRDGSVRRDLDADDTAHAIVSEGVGSAFLWTVDAREDFTRRMPGWRRRTLERLSP